MGDYISREAAIETLRRAEALTRAFGYHNVIDAIRELLPADVVEVKHGHWIHERLASTTGGSYPIVRCSICQGTIPFEWETHYCPNCGADMRGREDE